MEKTVSVEERIRRAEEIYNRRKENNLEENISKVNTYKKKNRKIFRKIIFRSIICLCLYFVLLNNNYIFSQDFRNKAKEILMYDTNFKSLYQKGIEKFNSIIDGIFDNNDLENTENIEDTNNAEGTENIENTDNTENANNTEEISNEVEEEKNIDSE
jgi:hypothetical protein